jgi:hypothetical protein
MTWLDLETDWLRTEHSCFFAPEDVEGIALFEAHLRTHRIPYVKRTALDVPAIVFSSPSLADEDMLIAA